MGSDLALRDKTEKLPVEEGRRVSCASAHSAKNDLGRTPPPTMFRGTLLAARDSERYIIGGRACQSGSAPPTPV